MSGKLFYRSKSMSDNITTKLAKTDEETKANMRDYHSPKLDVTSLSRRDTAAPSEKVLLIYTGGTIGMVESKNGEYVVQKGALQREMTHFHELEHPDVPDFDILEWDNIKDSSNFSPDDWTLLANNIHDNYYKYGGFVVLHGTDTMAYTASALSFMLCNLAKTVIVTGAMLPLNRPCSDGRRNLFNAMMLAVNESIKVGEVCVFMDTVLLRGNRSRKQYTDRPDAFFSPNENPLAHVGVDVRLSEGLVRPLPNRIFHLKTNMHKKIVSLAMIPGFDHDAVIETMLSHTDDLAIIFFMYGAGNASTKPSFLKLLKEGIENKKATIVISTQCIRGMVNLDAYDTGVALRDLGVINAHDMTPEAVSTKLAWLMGQGLRGLRLKQEMETNLRGELTEKRSDLSLARVVRRNSEPNLIELEDLEDVEILSRLSDSPMKHYPSSTASKHRSPRNGRNSIIMDLKINNLERAKNSKDFDPTVLPRSKG